MRIAIPRALEKLVDEAGNAFLKVHKELENEEELLWADEKANGDGE